MPPSANTPARTQTTHRPQTERILTVTQTLRLQKRQVLAFLYQALVAHRCGLPAPALLAGHKQTIDLMIEAAQRRIGR